MRILVIIPTYNERENIAAIIPAVLACGREVEILVVDDNSPDGTASVVIEQMRKDKRIHLLSRPGKEGLGRAYLAGFEWGLKNGFEALIEMDADFSHRPQDLPPLIDALREADFAVGSRYVRGGGTVNWGFLRKLISRGGGLYSRLILGYPLKDWTGGFNAWKASTLRKIGLESVRSEGYSFQIELKYRASRLGLHGTEIPIVFEDRRYGQSKMSSRIVLEALHHVWGMRHLD